MIEYALLFGLGFLTAAFLVFLLSPAVHRRIVAYTETRMRATMPLSPQEVRAQKDMVRALYAAENARTAQELLRERDKALSLQIDRDRLIGDAARLRTELAEREAHIGELDADAAELRARIRQHEAQIGQLKASLQGSEDAVAAKAKDVDDLRGRLARMADQANMLKLELVARETEIDRLKSEAHRLIEAEEQALRDADAAHERAKGSELRESKLDYEMRALTERLAQESAAINDRDRLAARRQKDIETLRKQLREAKTELRRATRALAGAGLALPAAKALDAEHEDDAMPTSDVRAAGLPPEEEAAIAADLSARSRALAESLLSEASEAPDAQRDAELREEIASIAAGMVTLTAMKEGPTSPIRALLTKAPRPDAGADGATLADRVAAALAQAETAPPSAG